MDLHLCMYPLETVITVGGILGSSHRGSFIGNGAWQRLWWQTGRLYNGELCAIISAQIPWSLCDSTIKALVLYKSIIMWNANRFNLSQVRRGSDRDCKAHVLLQIFRVCLIFTSVYSIEPRLLIEEPSYPHLTSHCFNISMKSLKAYCL